MTMSKTADKTVNGEHRLSINADRLWRRIEALAEITEPDRPWTRVAFSDLHKQGRRWLTGEMEAIGLAVSTDAGANLIGRLAGAEDERAPIVCGSHTDTVPRGGRFDGIAGVLVALEVAETIAESGAPLRHPFEVVDFLAEEPNQYGLSCIGSRALAGVLTPEQLGFVAPDGTTTAEGIATMGGDPAQLTAPLRAAGDVAGFFELHIEQGVVLEEDGVDIGVVTDIVGIARYHLTIVGEAAHAGTTPMNRRRDALVGAARMIAEAERLACTQDTGGAYLVATIGKLDVTPNGSNVVPGRVDFSIEIRSNRSAEIERFAEAFIDFARRTCAEAQLDIDLTKVSTGTPVACSEEVQEAFAEAARANGLSHIHMPSGAGHDAAYMAKVGPAGMIFIPCLKGRSHCPEEWADKEALARGAQVMLDAVRLFDQSAN
ncbi:N-carbamoyl-L-amino-acid hydrolase [Nitratireductor aquibiodomus]|uniref:N-carbamoyl-L-amino-acid hydrolase n=2 Tax=Nitratireductor aquibiodomus TaxID=204799 RepID=A0A1H4KGI0_9HYPH|nr:N-carbamoyl-L-amino-acid hydrolase [Nitratireductor aquibiodomus]